MDSEEDVIESFTEWNGWGPPDSEYQIIEFCKAKALSEEESNNLFIILFNWMNS